MKTTKTVLVTGGAGFIGSNFVDFLLKNRKEYQVVVLDGLTYAGNIENFTPEMRDNPRLKFFHGDVRNSELVNELVSKSHVVVHMAAETHVARSIFDNKGFYETDVLGTQVIANAVLKNRKRVERFIHISTSEVYGTAMQAPMTEEHPLDPTSPYASAKSGADRLVFSYQRCYDIPALIIRPFNNYGPRQHLEKAIPRFITSALLGEPLTIHGDGKSSRDWLFVEDHCRALLAAVEADLRLVKGAVINIGTGRDISIDEVARTVLKIMKKPEKLLRYIPERMGQVQRHISSVDRSHRLLNWHAEVSFEEGIRRTIQWYKKNPTWWKKLLWMRHVPIISEDGSVELY